MTTTTIFSIIEELEKAYSFNDCLKNYYDEADLLQACEDWDLSDYLEELDNDYAITQTDVIYYSNAIKYLAENDQSLTKSMEIAIEYGTPIENINSELLASLLMSKNNKDDYARFIDEVVEAYESIE